MVSIDRNTHSDTLRIILFTVSRSVFEADKDSNSNENSNELAYYNINWELLKYVEKIYEGTNKSPAKDLHYDKNGNQTLE